MNTLHDHLRLHCIVRYSAMRGDVLGIAVTPPRCKVLGFLCVRQARGLLGGLRVGHAEAGDVVAQSRVRGQQVQLVMRAQGADVAQT